MTAQPAPPAMYQPQLFGGEHVVIEQTSDSWCTPEAILGPVRDFYGAIDLDPCTNDGSTVGAATSYTLADDGLAHPWWGRVWCNPPYSDCAPWLARCAEMPSRGGEALALPKGDWSTSWWRDFIRGASAKCLLERRVQFAQPGRAKDPARRSMSPNFPSALVYWGARVADFARVFGSLGEVIQGEPSRRPALPYSASERYPEATGDQVEIAYRDAGEYWGGGGGRDDS